jgi:hypothetical protein
MLKGNTLVSAAVPISANGNYCQVATSLPQIMPASGIYDSYEDVFDSAQYLIQTGTGVSAGTISVALLTLSPAGAPVWVTATTPNSATGAAFTLVAALGASATYNGSLDVPGSKFTPCLGMRLVVAGLTGGNITLMQLYLTKR